MPKDQSLWDEFEWESAFKKGDELAHSYFKLFGKYADFPEGREAIEATISQEYSNLSDFFESDLILADENPALVGEEIESDELEQVNDNFGEFISSELCLHLKAASLGWCTINSVLINPENHKLGVGVLYYLGRSLGTATCTLESELTVPATVAFLKRSLAYLNMAVGLVQEIIENNPKLTLVLDGFVGQLTTAHDVAVEVLLSVKNIK
jgi:hypothetical protein